ncbi:iron chaperone [Paenibacillus sp. NFR01]|uniref:iron chaperone n=1 Tax=Paenibacillus sp. NFR01 TaxID=1566279 RepID=UPI0008BF2B4E|nr:DUF1801 domain-containing protein [Paenibacillus sp. NFR01]SES94873.1 Uncharacterized conserved protein YdhG, YjbR/CyaY-like superfamily, DUF1801 family [Paenibacillus sp. NFR01]
MKEEQKSFATIDEYIASCRPELQDSLHQLRQTIKEAAPEAKEKFSYGMPTFDLHGNLVHFAAFKNHIGFYPAPSGIAGFEEEVKPYHKSKGTLQFPLDVPVPFDLVARIVKFRVAENIEKAQSKKAKKKAATAD